VRLVSTRMSRVFSGAHHPRPSPKPVPERRGPELEPREGRLGTRDSRRQPSFRFGSARTQLQSLSAEDRPTPLSPRLAPSLSVPPSAPPTILLFSQLHPDLASRACIGTVNAYACVRVTVCCAREPDPPTPPSLALPHAPFGFFLARPPPSIPNDPHPTPPT
jgi:hypothetical protein